MLKTRFDAPRPLSLSLSRLRVKLDNAGQSTKIHRTACTLEYSRNSLVQRPKRTKKALFQFKFRFQGHTITLYLPLFLCAVRYFRFISGTSYEQMSPIRNDTGYYVQISKSVTMLTQKLVRQQAFPRVCLFMPSETSGWKKRGNAHARVSLFSSKHGPGLAARNPRKRFLWRPTTWNLDSSHTSVQNRRKETINMEPSRLP